MTLTLPLSCSRPIKMYNNTVLNHLEHNQHKESPKTIQELRGFATNRPEIRHRPTIYLTQRLCCSLAVGGTKTMERPCMAMHITMEGFISLGQWGLFHGRHFGMLGAYRWMHQHNVRIVLSYNVHFS